MATDQKKPELSVVIVYYNTPKHTTNLLDALGNDSRVEIIVIDHSPDDHFKSVIQSSYTHVTYVFRRGNFGYSAGVNEGVRRSCGEWIMILNSDILIGSQELLVLRDEVHATGHYVAAPCIIPENKNELQAGYFDSFTSYPVNALFMRPRMIDIQHKKHPIFVDYVIGAALLIRRAVFETIGIFDEGRFFMYFEDLDFCLRLKRGGYPIYINPTITAKHIGGASSSSKVKEKMSRYRSSRVQYLTKYRGRFLAYLNELLLILH